MILVTGATGFVGRRLVRRLATLPHMDVRVLVRPGTDMNRLPRGTSVLVKMADLSNQEALTEAMEGVHTVYHLIGTDTRGRHQEMQAVDIAGTRRLVRAALEGRVGRIITVSRVGASRASAYPTLRAKGEIEEIIKASGLAYTIFRSSVLFGEHDHFSEHIAMLAQAFPVYLVPGDGDQVFQPLWVEDLVTCLTMTLQDIDMLDETMVVGGPELLTYRRIVMRVMYAIGSQRPIMSMPLLTMQWGAWFLDGLFARWPFTEQWVELLSANQTAELGNIERQFGFRPAAFDIGLIDKYMKDRRYAAEMVRYIFSQTW